MKALLLLVPAVCVSLLAFAACDDEEQSPGTLPPTATHTTATPEPSATPEPTLRYCEECFPVPMVEPPPPPDPPAPCPAEAPPVPFASIETVGTSGWRDYSSTRDAFGFRYPEDWRLNVDENDIYYLPDGPVRGPVTTLINLYNPFWPDPAQTVPGQGISEGAAKVEISVNRQILYVDPCAGLDEERAFAEEIVLDRYDRETEAYYFVDERDETWHSFTIAVRAAPDAFVVIAAGTNDAARLPVIKAILESITSTLDTSNLQPPPSLPPPPRACYNHSRPMRFAVVVFPGTWSDHDTQHSLTVAGYPADLVWHRETDLSSYDCIVLPGGFSYGDYLRAGAIARFSPVMETVVRDAAAGKPVIGICNGFQVLCEAHLLPGALMRNDSLQYRCEWVHLLVENAETPFTQKCEPGQLLRVPISHGEGRYFADAPTLDELENTSRVVFRYSTPAGEATPDANPNGSVNNIAGIVNDRGNVLGMMPHPERAAEPLLGGDDGLLIWHSLADWAAVRA